MRGRTREKVAGRNSQLTGPHRRDHRTPPPGSRDGTAGATGHHRLDRCNRTSGHQLPVPHSPNGFGESPDITACLAGTFPTTRRTPPVHGPAELCHEPVTCQAAVEVRRPLDHAAPAIEEVAPPPPGLMETASYDASTLFRPMSWSNITLMALSKKKATTIALDPAHDRLLTRAARERGVSRSEFIRQQLSLVLEQYRRHPAPTSGGVLQRLKQRGDERELFGGRR